MDGFVGDVWVTTDFVVFGSVELRFFLQILENLI